MQNRNRAGDDARSHVTALSSSFIFMRRVLLFSPSLSLCVCVRLYFFCLSDGTELRPARTHSCLIQGLCSHLQHEKMHRVRERHDRAARGREARVALPWKERNRRRECSGRRQRRCSAPLHPAFISSRPSQCLCTSVPGLFRKG